MQNLLSSIYRTLSLQRLLRLIRAHSSARPDWSWLADTEWDTLRTNANNGPRILIATGTGSNWPCSALESLLGVALTLRGADVRFLLCDGALPACQECDKQWLPEIDFINHGPASLCQSCYLPAKAMLMPLGLPILGYSQFLDERSIGIRPELNLACDEHALAGTLRYFGRGTLHHGEVESAILDRYRQATAITVSVMRRLVAEQRPDVALFHHGIYVPQGVVGDVLREAGVRVVNWGPSYRKSTVLFSHGDTYHRTMIDEQPSVWKDMGWSAHHERQIADYLRSRWTGANDWISFQNEAMSDGQFIAKKLGLDFSRPVVGLLTNVIWDAQLHFKQSAFPSMLEWLFASIEYFKRRTDVQWVIRVHPAEVYGSVPSNQRVIDEIARRFGKLPSHIKLVGPEDKISTYSLMARCNAALVYGTKTALELACTGLPVVIAGESWCRGKGFTFDVSSPEEYLSLLENLPFTNRLSSEKITAARKYAYHFFFRRMIPVKALKPMRSLAPYKIKVRSLKELMPGYDQGLDVICDGILKGSPFIYEP